MPRTIEYIERLNNLKWKWDISNQWKMLNDAVDKFNNQELEVYFGDNTELYSSVVEILDNIETRNFDVFGLYLEEKGYSWDEDLLLVPQAESHEEVITFADAIINEKSDFIKWTKEATCDYSMYRF